MCENMGWKAVPCTVTLAALDLFLGKKVVSPLSTVDTRDVVEAEMCISLHSES